MSKCWHLPNYVKLYYFSSMVNEQLHRQKSMTFFSLFPLTSHFHSGFVYLSHLMVPDVQSPTPHQACLFWCCVNGYQPCCDFGQLV